VYSAAIADTPSQYQTADLSQEARRLSMSQSLTYLVPGMSCEHCAVAVTGEVMKVGGVAGVDVDLDSKLVRVHGTAVDAASVAAAIDEAGYDAVAA
jgi:copper chaperone